MIRMQATKLEHAIHINYTAWLLGTLVILVFLREVTTGDLDNHLDKAADCISGSLGATSIKQGKT